MVPCRKGNDTAASASSAPGRENWRRSSLPRLAWPDRAALLVIAADTVVLIVLAARLSPDRFEYVFSEEGPFEEGAILLWLVAGLIVILRARPFTSRSAIFVVLFAAFAAREASWHKAYTTDSLLKISYYLKAPAPLAEKVLAALVAAAFIAMLLYAAYAVVRFLLVDGGISSRAGYWVIFAGALFVLAKVVDRTPSVLYDYTGHDLNVDLRRLMLAFEEGFEALTPALFALSAWVSRSDRPYLS